MTPPDSGEITDDEFDAVECADSGEHEVPVDVAEMRRFWTPALAADSETAKTVMHLLAEVERVRIGVLLDRSLAQRILAALEHGWMREQDPHDLASELRAAVERKP